MNAHIRILFKVLARELILWEGKPHPAVFYLQLHCPLPFNQGRGSLATGPHLTPILAVAL